VVNARSNRAEADAVAREIDTAGGKALVHIGDVADAVAVQAMADAAVKQFSRIDILVNNAALRREKPFAEMSYAAWREILDVTLDGTFLCTKACLSALRRCGNDRQYRWPQRTHGCEESRACGDGEGGHYRPDAGAGPRSCR
jgi:3-oxoacyl-[acyl-carrier protein] reductase